MQPLDFEHTYHIFNRAIGNEQLFVVDENYRFFLEKVKEYLLPFADVLSYCLMPNHFHFLVRFKSLEEVFVETLPKFKTLEELKAENTFLSKQFSRLFSSYTQAYNKVYHRKGSLFMKNFKRIKVQENQYLLKLVHYIHSNPKEAGLVQKISDWKYSSYNAILSNSPTFIKRKEVIDLFDDLENFKYVHNLLAPEI